MEGDVIALAGVVAGVHYSGDIIAGIIIYFLAYLLTDKDSKVAAKKVTLFS